MYKFYRFRTFSNKADSKVLGKGVVFLLHIHSPLTPSVVNMNQEIRCDNEMVRIKSISKSIWEEVDFGRFVFIPPINAIESTT